MGLWAAMILMKGSRFDRWLPEKMAAPSRGIFSKPLKWTLVTLLRRTGTKASQNLYNIGVLKRSPVPSSPALSEIASNDDPDSFTMDVTSGPPFHSLSIHGK